MSPGSIDSLERMTPAELIGLVRRLIGEGERLRAEYEKVNQVAAWLRVENQTLKDEIARLKRCRRAAAQAVRDGESDGRAGAPCGGREGRGVDAPARPWRLQAFDRPGGDADRDLPPLAPPDGRSPDWLSKARFGAAGFTCPGPAAQRSAHGPRVTHPVAFERNLWPLTNPAEILGQAIDLIVVTRSREAE